MTAPSFDDLVESIRFSSLLMSPVCGGTNDALALQLERLANVAATLAVRPSAQFARTIALEAAYHRAYAVARVLPELQAYEHPGWVLSEATAAIETVERCRAEVDFPLVLADLLVDLRVELAAFAHARANAA
jgi:hypothetical protein